MEGRLQVTTMPIDRDTKFGTDKSYELISEETYLERLKEMAKLELDEATDEEILREDFNIEASDRAIGTHSWFVGYQRPFLWLSILMNGQQDVELVRDPDHYLQAGDTLIDKLEIMAQLQVEVDLYRILDEMKEKYGVQTSLGDV
jgi:hypothetical protein